MKIQLSEHFTYSKLLRFTFPSIIMMIFTSIYSVIDGLFVSNFAGKTALAAHQYHLSFYHGCRGTRLHDGNRRQRSRRQTAW